MLLISALGKQRQADLSEFEVSHAYKSSSRTARSVIQRNPVSKSQIKGKKKRKNSVAKKPSNIESLRCQVPKYYYI